MVSRNDHTIIPENNGTPHRRRGDYNYAEDGADSGSPIELVLNSLTYKRCHFVRSSDDWIAQCPAHTDVNPSLSISEDAVGRVLLYCHAGCETEDVLQALGLEWSDLFPDGDQEQTQYRHPKSNRRNNEVPIIGYPYHIGIDDPQLKKLADQLGIPAVILSELGIGWSNDHVAWTWPERDADGNVIGIALTGR